MNLLKAEISSLLDHRPPCNMYQLPPHSSALCLDLWLLLLHKIQRLLQVEREYKEDLSDPH